MTRLLLITGTPGCGKRTIGNLLAAERSYEHLGLDDAAATRRFVAYGANGLRGEIDAALRAGKNVVVTWSSASAAALPSIRALQELGFEWIWVDGDRGAAIHAAFDGWDGAEPPRFLDSFELDGRFRPLAGVLDELLAPEPVAAPAPEPSRPARPRRRLRTRAAAGLALGAAALAAASSYLVAGPALRGKPTAVTAAPVAAKPAVLPRQGVLVPGRSLAGVRLGDTREDVRAQWGHRFSVCKTRTCKPNTWIYLYPSGDQTGAGVRFRNGRVAAVFTLGMTPGWRTAAGLRVGELLDNPRPGEDTRWMTCAGFGAKVQPAAGAVTSILTVGPAVYGFSLTRPGETICH